MSKIELYEYNGKKYTLQQWADLYGIKYNTLYVRVVKRNWPMEDAIEHILCAKRPKWKINKEKENDSKNSERRDEARKWPSV